VSVDGSLPSSGRLPATRPHRSLFVKYVVTLFVAVVVPLVLGAISEAWFGYQDRRVHLNELLLAEARSATDRIQTFIVGIRNQLGFVVQLPWIDGDDELHRLDALRLLRQVPAIASITLLDQAGTERAFVSRLSPDRIGRGADMSADPAVLGVRADANKVWYGSVRYLRESEPYMTIATIRIGETGYAFVVDDSGRLIAHPNISLVLRGDTATSRLQSVIAGANGSAVTANDGEGKSVVAISARTADIGWTVVALQPVNEALAPIRAALWRSLALIGIGAILAFALAYWLARRMSGPIRQLEDGVQRVGAGQFDHRITISSGDELEQLAGRFNEMAGELAISKEKSERINRLKRFLAPQVAELVEHSGDERLLDGQRRDVVAIFGDLRGFTAFSAHVEPDVIMAVVREYYEALGAVVTRHGATLTGFDGDGVMVLVNAPVACEDPASRGLRLAIDMQAAVQSLIVRWRADGHAIGFGIGIAKGPATVGAVGYKGRMDYTAIGSVINLAKRLCDSAVDAQILVDPVAAEAVKSRIALASLGERPIKGYDHPLPVFAVSSGFVLIDRIDVT